MRESLARIRDEAEKQIKSEFSGIGGLVKRALYNSRMPLSVMISADDERHELVFMQDGDIELRQGSSSTSDIVIESDAHTLERLFTKRNSDEFRLLENQRKISIAATSRKGREAESYIRSFLGL